MTLRPIFYDTETTGISPENDRIIEIAAYDPERDASFCQLVNPGRPIPAEASAIHQITDAMVQDALPFSEIGKEFMKFCEGDVVLIAHNNDAFDLHFIRNEFRRNSLTMPQWRFFDTLKWARRYRPDLPRHSLQYLREMYGIASNTAHRALDDVMVLFQVYTSMVDDLSIQTVLDLIGKHYTIRQMPFGKHKGTALQDLPKDYIDWLSNSGAFEKEENGALYDSFKQLGLL